MERSLSLSNIDSKSQYSSTRKNEKAMMAGGNGNPMGLPGIPRDGVGIRQAAPLAIGLDKQSVSSASLDRTSQRRYIDGSNS